MRWPHRQADQVRGLRLREIGGGFTRHHRAPSTHAACHAIIKPSTLVQKMQNIKRVRGHRNAVYCGKVLPTFSYPRSSNNQYCNKMKFLCGFVNLNEDNVTEFNAFS